MRCRTRHAGGCRGGRVHTAAKVALGGGGVPPMIHAVQYDGATEDATSAAGAAMSPSESPSGAVAMWVRGTDAAGSIFTWSDVGGNNRLILLPGAGGACRMFVQMAGTGRVDTTGTTDITDGAWHLIGFSWTWAGGCQLYVDGAPDGAFDSTTDAWPASPAMNDITIAKADWAGKIARCAVFGVLRNAAWWAAAYAAPQQQWMDAANDWRMGDTVADRPNLVTIADVRGGLDLTTTGMGAANLIVDHP